MKRVLALYGAHPLHALALLGCFALTAVAVVQLSEVPRTGRVLLWFAGAVVVHDLVLYPLYALADRGLLRVRRLRGNPNWVRVPALLSGLMLLMFYPVIAQRGEGAFQRASGLTQDPFLERWLLLTAALFLGSALLFALTRARSRSLTRARARSPRTINASSSATRRAGRPGGGPG